VTVATDGFEARARPADGVRTGDRVAVCVRPEHVIILRADRPHANELDTTLDAEIVDEVASGNTHRMYFRAGTTDRVIEADISAHPYEVMGIASQRQWRLALTLEHTVAIRLDGAD
jgi:hypothetical protein